ncbi:unnamed protein product, partial [marine sediment metagenome]
KDAIETMKPLRQLKSMMDILENTGNFHFMGAFNRQALNCPGPVIAFPSSYFYPAPNSELNKPTDVMDRWIRPESFAIHYWGCSWMKREGFVPSVLK